MIFCSLPSSSSVSSLPSILAWDDTPEPSAQWRPVPAAVYYPSSDQILVSEPLPCNAVHEAVQPLQGVPLYVALVEPKRELVNVAVQVLITGVVIDAVQSALQNGPNALNPVRRHAIIPHILARGVNDGLVLVVAGETNIAVMLVGVDHCARLDALPDFHAQPRSRIPGTVVLPTVPRPACNFLCSCLLPSFPPI